MKNRKLQIFYTEVKVEKDSAPVLVSVCDIVHHLPAAAMEAENVAMPLQIISGWLWSRET